MKKQVDMGNIMHGLSDQSAVGEDIVRENMPVFPRISRSKNLSMLLANRIKGYETISQGVLILAEGIYIDEKYTYRYFDYRQVFTPKQNTSTLAIRVQFINERTVRVSMAEGFAVPDNRTEMIREMEIEPVAVQVRSQGNELFITGGELTVVIEKEPWNLRIVNRQNQVVYCQFGKDEHSFMPYEICPFGFLFDQNSGKQYACEANTLGVYEDIYGLGENFTSLRRNGRAFDLWNTNSLGVNTERGYKYIPFYISSQGYGMFINTSRELRCDMGAAISKANSIMVEGGLLDFFIIEGQGAKEILPYYYRLTGFPALVPKWSLGLWISKISYRSREEVETVAAKMREYDIPCDVIHIDTDWFAENWVCDWQFDEGRFPQVEEMIAGLHEKGYKISLWQLPYVERGNISTKVYDEGVANGYFASNPAGDMQFAHGLIDFSNPEAVCWYQDQLIKPLLRKGIDVIKVDFGESAPPFFKYAGLDGAEMHNLYALLYNQAAYEATKEELGEEQALIWARSAWAGSQRYPVHWGGDAGTDFGSLASSLKGCLSLSLSGIPFWSSDIGGFWFEGGPQLYIRWVQWGMFCSHARLHGFYSREPWDYGEEALTVCRDFVKLRYRLLPYIYNNCLGVKETCQPIHRAMVYEYPHDPQVVSLDTQYLFGRDLLVAPVLREDSLVQYYLPEGQWTDFFTDEQVQGPVWRRETAALDRIPVFVRENGMIPMGPSMNYVDEITDYPLEIHCYPGNGVSEFPCYDRGFVLRMEAGKEEIRITTDRLVKNIRIYLHNLGHVVKTVILDGKELSVVRENHRIMTAVPESAVTGMELVFR